jgi:hypothetical protein
MQDGPAPSHEGVGPFSSRTAKGQRVGVVGRAAATRRTGMEGRTGLRRGRQPRVENADRLASALRVAAGEEGAGLVRRHPAARICLPSRRADGVETVVAVVLPLRPDGMAVKLLTRRPSAAMRIRAPAVRSGPWRRRPSGASDVSLHAASDEAVLILVARPARAPCGLPALPSTPFRERTMRKIRLQLESLTVESFDTSAVKAPGGTVLAYDRTEACTNTCGDSCINSACTCPQFGTCLASCNGTCVQSCNGSCFGNTCPASCVDTCGTCGANTCEPTCGDCSGWC